METALFARLVNVAYTNIQMQPLKEEIRYLGGTLTHPMRRERLSGFEIINVANCKIANKIVNLIYL